MTKNPKTTTKQKNIKSNKNNKDSNHHIIIMIMSLTMLLIEQQNRKDNAVKFIQFLFPCDDFVLFFLIVNISSVSEVDKIREKSKIENCQSINLINYQ